MRSDPSFFSQMAVGLLLVKLVGLSIVCLSCYCRQKVVCKVSRVIGPSQDYTRPDDHNLPTYNL